jgi:hypothetical protein
MAAEMKRAIEEKREDPAVYAKILCTIIATACKEDPEGDSCKKMILDYSGNQPRIGTTAHPTTPSAPLDNLVGSWDLTTFMFGGGHQGDSPCGILHRPVSIGPVTGNRVSLSAFCDDGSEHIFELKRSTGDRNYLITVRNKEGISVVDFPVQYVEGKGWAGSRGQRVEGKEVSITATIKPMEGDKWHGWAVTVSRAEDADRNMKDIKTPYLRFDLTRRRD